MHTATALLVFLSLDVAAQYRATAAVIAFSDDGTRALLEERTPAPDGTGELAYRVVGLQGGALRVRVSQVGLAGLQYRELVEREDCRAAAEQLEAALEDFQDVRVHEGACGMASRTGVVRTLRMAPSPVRDVRELEPLTREIGVVGSVWASEDGPLVVVVSPNTTSALGDNFTIRVFAREDPRLHDRWEAPSPAP